MKPILSIAGKPGLYNLVSSGKNMLIVESVEEPHRRFPAYSSDRVTSLGDISVYTTEGDKPLYDVLQAVADFNEGKPVDLKALDSTDKLFEYFGQIVPTFDRDQVHGSDVRKLLSWYNLLIANGVTKFKDDDIAEDKSAEASDPGTADAAATFEAEKEKDNDAKPE